MDGFDPVEDDPQVVALKSRDEQLAARIAALGADVEAKRKKSLELFRDTNAGKFEGYNWKAALAGAGVDLAIKVAGFTVFARLATGQTAQAVAAYLTELNGPLPKNDAASKALAERKATLLPISNIEAALLQRITGVEANGQRGDLSQLHFDEKLARIRVFSSTLTDAVVRRCELLEDWLNAQMELESGN